MSSLFIYLHLLIFSATVLSAPNLGLFLDGSATNAFGDLELDQDSGAGYSSLLLATPPPSEPPTDNWTNSPAEPIHLQEIAIQQERLITNDVPPQATRPTLAHDGMWYFNRSPLSRHSSNPCPAGFNPLGKRQVCSADSAEKWTEPVRNPYNPDLNFLNTLPMYPPSEHREPCGLFSGAPRWAICDSADPRDRYPAGITIAKATLCMPLVSPPKSNKKFTAG